MTFQSIAMMRYQEKIKKTLAETLQALEAHIEADCKREGTKPGEYCPCTVNEVVRARAILKGES